MEDGLVRASLMFREQSNKGLNPYCSGRWSRTAIEEAISRGIKVLILIVVEDGLVPDDS